MARVGPGRRAWWLLFLGVLALGWSVATATPAAANGKVTANLVSECGVAVITVTNPTDEAVTFLLGFQEQAAQELTVPAVFKRTLRIPITARVKFDFSGAADVADAVLTYVAPASCDSVQLVLDVQRGCANALITAVNVGDAAAPNVRIVAADKVVAAGSIQSDGALQAVGEPRPGEDHIDVAVQQRADEPSNVFFEVLTTRVFLKDCKDLEVAVTDTCTGVHVKVTNVDEQFQVLSIRSESGGPVVEDFAVLTAIRGFEVPVPADTVISIGFAAPSGRIVARYHQHVADCPPSSPPPSERPVPQPGGGGGLPVTGTPIAAAAGAGAGLLLLGLVFVLVLSRRRATFTA